MAWNGVGKRGGLAAFIWSSLIDEACERQDSMSILLVCCYMRVNSSACKGCDTCSGRSRCVYYSNREGFACIALYLSERGMRRGIIVKYLSFIDIVLILSCAVM